MLNTIYLKISKIYKEKQKIIINYSAFMLLTGICLISLTNKNDDNNKLLLFFNNLGFNLLSVAIVGILLGFKDWRNYFQDRLSDIVLGKSYIKNLSKEQLINLQNDTIKAYFETDSVEREGSFLNYFHQEIRSLIGAPFRENINLIINVAHNEQDNIVHFNETIIYECREVGGIIQDSVRWVPRPDEFHKIENLLIVIKCPTKYKNKCNSNCSTCGEEIVLFDSSKESEKCLEKAVSVPLDAYKNIDGLFVKILSNYQVNVNKHITWQMAHPTKGISLVIRYPETYVMAHDIFGMTREKLNIIDSKGLFNLTYNDWILPYNGVVYQLIKKGS